MSLPTYPGIGTYHVGKYLCMLLVHPRYQGAEERTYTHEHHWHQHQQYTSTTGVTRLQAHAMSVADYFTEEADRFPSLDTYLSVLPRCHEPTYVFLGTLPRLQLNWGRIGVRGGGNK